MFHKVIVGFDGSDHARDALALSECLAAPDAELIVCCVHRFKGLFSEVDPEEPRLDSAAAARCVQAACQLPHGARTIVPLALAGAGAAQTLQTAARQRGADLLVLGSSHRGAVGRVLVGSVTEETLHEAPCPVAVAPVGFHRSPNPSGIGKIAVAYDDELGADTALQVAGKLAAQTGAHLQVIAIATTATPMVVGSTADLAYSANIDTRVQMAEHDLETAIASLPKGLTVTSEARRGLPAEEIIQSSHGVDLLVLGSRGRGPLRRMVLGSVSDAVVRAAACPVLIVPLLAETEHATRRSSDTLAGA